MKRTKAHKKAGILEIRNQNTNGSWNCIVDLSKLTIGLAGFNWRQFDKKHAEDINRKYNKRCTRNPILVFVDGVMGIVDGQHTIWVMIENDHTEVTCDVHMNLDRSDRAELFYHLTQNSKRMGAKDEFVAAVVGGNNTECDIHEALTEHGFKTHVEGRSHFKGYEPFRKAHKAGMIKQLAQVLTAWFDDGCLETIASNNYFQNGLWRFLESLYENHPAIDHASIMLERMSHHSSNQVYYHAANFADQRRSLNGKWQSRVGYGDYAKAFSLLFRDHAI